MNFLRRIKLLSPKEGYELWAKSYHAEANPIKRMSDEFIGENLPDLHGKSVLDAGCGTGKFCAVAVERGAAMVKGMDLSPAMIEEAQKNCPSASLECADLATVSITPNQFDVIICGLVLGHIEDHLPAVAKLIDALKNKGVIILTDFHPEQTASKAKRTFKDSQSGRTFEIKHTGHSIDSYKSVFRETGVVQSAFKEPRYSGKPVIFGIAGVKS
jgi:malonyl-CoA O-methyltransferase